MCRGVHDSVVHSHVLPVISNSPYPFGGNEPTGAVPTQPFAPVFSYGNLPCHVLTGPDVGTKMSELDSRLASAAPGKSAGSSGRSATVT